VDSLHHPTHRASLRTPTAPVLLSRPSGVAHAPYVLADGYRVGQSGARSSRLHRSEDIEDARLRLFLRWWCQRHDEGHGMPPSTLTACADNNAGDGADDPPG
jgi:hypothetical protein